MRNLKVMLVAGEPSGDLHGSAAEEILRQQPGARLGMGGRLMKDAGVRLLNPRPSAVSVSRSAEECPGPATAAAQAGEIADRQQPDVVVLIDFPGFNMRLRKLKRKGIPVSTISAFCVGLGPGTGGKGLETVTKVLAVFPRVRSLQRGRCRCGVCRPSALDIVPEPIPKEEAWETLGLPQDVLAHRLAAWQPECQRSKAFCPSCSRQWSFWEEDAWNSAGSCCSRDNTC